MVWPAVAHTETKPHPFSERVPGLREPSPTQSAPLIKTAQRAIVSVRKQNEMCTINKKPLMTLAPC